MAKSSSYEVPTRVLIDQTRATISQLQAPANKPGIDTLATVQFDAVPFIPTLSQQLEKLITAESEQERAKAAYIRETAEDREVAATGYRWILRLHSRIDMFCANHPEEDKNEWHVRFRFGKISNVRVRGIVYELRILIPELEEAIPQLGDTFTSFLDGGKNILEKLGIERNETEAAKQARKALTRMVHKAEEDVTMLLRQLEAADEAAALESPEAKRWFTLDIIHTEKARVKAMRELRMSSHPDTLLSETDDSETGSTTAEPASVN